MSYNKWKDIFAPIVFPYSDYCIGNDSVYILNIINLIEQRTKNISMAGNIKLN